MLVGVAAFDEAASGLPVAGTFALQDAFAADMASLTTAVFVVPQLVALVEAPLLLWLERWPRPRVMGIGLLGMGLATLICAAAPDLLWVAVGCSVYYPSSGIACSIAQASLMDAAPEKREHHMADWAVWGWIGDLATPLLLWAAHAAGLGWRGAFAALGGLVVLAAPLLMRALPNAVAITEPEAPDDDELGLVSSVKLLLQRRLLFLWLAGVALCSLHDEILSSFASIRIFADTRETATVAWNLSALTVGGICGLALLKLWLRRSEPERILAFACWGSAVAYVAWLMNTGTWSNVLLLFLCGGFVSLHYPIAQAAAYRALPGRSTLVAAAGQAFAVFDLLVPLGLGWLSDRLGVLAALWVLLLQPLGLLLVLSAVGRRR